MLRELDAHHNRCYSPCKSDHLEWISDLISYQNCWWQITEIPSLSNDFDFSAHTKKAGKRKRVLHCCRHYRCLTSSSSCKATTTIGTRTASRVSNNLSSVDCKNKKMKTKTIKSGPVQSIVSVTTEKWTATTTVEISKTNNTNININSIISSS